MITRDQHLSCRSSSLPVARSTRKRLFAPSRVQGKIMVFKFGAMSCFNQHILEFEYDFCLYTYKGVHPCFVVSPGKMIFAVLEL